MSDIGEKLRILTHDAVGSVKKRRQISSFLKKCGLLSLGRGAWLGFRNEDILSGLIVEGSPVDTYISIFILPAFDKNEFVSWSLGWRAVHCSLNDATQDECRAAIDAYTNSVWSVRSASELLSYIDKSNVTGYYQIWVRYICYLRLSHFKKAAEVISRNELAKLHQSKLEQFRDINKFAAAGDTEAVRQVFRIWSRTSERIFGRLDETFNAFEAI